MHDIWNQIDPAVSNLVQEVAAHPHSSLLRSSDPGDAPACAREAGLTAAERHLVRAHRGEGADLLRKVVRRRIAEDPRSQDLFESHRPRPERRPLDPGEVRRRATHLARTRRHLDADSARILRKVGSTEIESAVLARTAHRLVPSPLTAVQLAILASLDERYEDARKLLLPVVRGCLDPELRAYACCNLGLVYSLRGKIQLALGRYLEAAGLIPGWELPLYSAFTNALQIGDERIVGTLLQRIHREVDPESPGLREFIESHARRLQRGEWAPSTRGRRLGRSFDRGDSPLLPLIALFQGADESEVPA